MAEERDWADELADKIVPIVKTGRGNKIYLAAQLRLVEAQGYGRGLDACEKIIKGPAK